MKWIAIALLASGLALPGFAQPPGFELEDDVEPTSEMPDFIEQIEPPPALSPDSPVFRWLQRLRERNPALHERLEQLYRENPPAFHLRVRRLMEQERVRLVLQRYPAVSEAVSKLSPEERTNFYRDMAFPDLPPPRGPAPHRGPPLGRHSGNGQRMGHERPFFRPMREHADLLRQMADMRTRYQNASSPEEKAAIRTEAKGALEQILARRKARMMERIERIEAELSRVKGELDMANSREAELLEQKLSEWLESTNAPPFGQMNAPPEEP